MPRPRPAGPVLKQRAGIWFVEWWEDGRRRRLSTRLEDPIGAKQFLADFEAEAERRPVKLTVAEALDRYEASRVGKVEALGRLQDAAKALKADLGDLRVDQITQSRWDRYTRGRMTKPRGPRDAKHVPKPIATGTLRREFNVLRAALRKAWKDDLLTKPPTIEPPAEGAPRDRYLTRGEARRLIDACVEPHVRTFMALSLYTGARKGAILGLQWDRVNWETGKIDFSEPGRAHAIKRRSIVPISDELREHLEVADKLRGKSGFVVEYHGAPVPTGLRWSFQRLCRRAGLTWTPTPHHIRHSVASWMAMARVPVDQTADFLAVDPKTLRRVYRKFDPEYLRETAEAVKL